MTLNAVYNLLHKFIVILGFVGLIVVMSGANAMDSADQEVLTIQVPSPSLDKTI